MSFYSELNTSTGDFTGKVIEADEASRALNLSPGCEWVAGNYNHRWKMVDGVPTHFPLDLSAFTPQQRIMLGDSV